MAKVTSVADEVAAGVAFTADKVVTEAASAAYEVVAETASTADKIVAELRLRQTTRPRQRPRRTRFWPGLRLR